MMYVRITPSPCVQIAQLSLEDAEAAKRNAPTRSLRVDHMHILEQAQMSGLSVYGGGVLVTKVVPGGAAWDSGLQVWDLIVHVNGLDVRTGMNPFWFQFAPAMTTLSSQAFFFSTKHDP